MVAAAEGNQPPGIFPQGLPGHQALVPGAPGEARGDQPAQGLVAGAVFREQRQVGPVFGGDLRPLDGLDAKPLGELVEFHRGTDIAVIRYGQGRHFPLVRLVQQCLQRGGTVEKRIGRMDMQVHKHADPSLNRSSGRESTAPVRVENAAHSGICR